jgi:hypothetical protein
MPQPAGAAQLVEQRAEALAVLGAVDRVGAGAEDRHAGLGQRLRQLQRRLAAELHDHAVAAARDRTIVQHVLEVSGSKYSRSEVS